MVHRLQLSRTRRRPTTWWRWTAPTTARATRPLRYSVVRQAAQGSNSPQPANDTSSAEFPRTAARECISSSTLSLPSARPPRRAALHHLFLAPLPQRRRQSPPPRRPRCPRHRTRRCPAALPGRPRSLSDWVWQRS